MNKSKAHPQRAMTATEHTCQQPSAVVKARHEGYPENAEDVEEAFDIVDEASWASFPASDAPGWISTRIMNESAQANTHTRPNRLAGMSRQGTKVARET